LQAIISDLHGNLEALEAVLADIRSQNISEILCLGDIIGYGPNPKECIDVARSFKFTIMGNHDEAALFQSEAAYFNLKAKAALDWTRQLLEDPADSLSNGKRWEFLGELQRSYEVGDILFVHGSPRNPVKEYIFPEIVNLPNKLTNIFERVPRVCFIGHTHLAGVFTEDLQFYTPAQLGNVFEVRDSKAIINVGSVGQPRDGDPTACYVVFDGNTAWFRRVEYDFYNTMEKIYAVSELDNDLANRLAEGR